MTPNPDPQPTTSTEKAARDGFTQGVAWSNARSKLQPEGATTQPTPALISDVDVGCPACNGVNRHHPDCPDLAQPVPSAGSKPQEEGGGKAAQQVECMDCGLDYGQYPLDVVLKREQWLLIHPDDGGVLCANCIVARAAKLPNIINLSARITFASDFSRKVGRGEHQVMSESVLKQGVRENPLKKLAEMLQEAGAVPVIDGVSIYEDRVTMPKARFLELLAEPEALHAKIAKLTLLSDSQLATAMKAAEEHQVLLAAICDSPTGGEYLNADRLVDAFIKEQIRLQEELATERANQERLTEELATLTTHCGYLQGELNAVLAREYATTIRYDAKLDKANASQERLVGEMAQAESRKLLQLPLSMGKVASIDTEDFPLISGTKWFACLDKTTGSYYAATNAWIDGRRRMVYMHRLILGLKPGDERQADHIDPSQTLNNSRSNLRISTPGQNAANCRKQKNNKSGYKGVHWKPSEGKWIAQIYYDGVNHTIGRFVTAEEANEAYVAEARRLHGEFARTQ